MTNHLQLKKKRTNGNKEATTFSLTIRTGVGFPWFITDSSPFTNLISYLLPLCTDLVLNLEKEGLEQHIQGAIKLRTSKRTDNFRRDLLPYIMPMFMLAKPKAQQFQIENFKKYGICLKASTSIEKQIYYCMKDLRHCWHYQEDPTTLLIYECSREKYWKLSERLKRISEAWYSPVHPDGRIDFNIFNRLGDSEDEDN